MSAAIHSTPPEAVRAAERRVRENGIRASGIDPRILRKFARTLGREI